jgi:hypothetical protein
MHVLALAQSGQGGVGEMQSAPNPPKNSPGELLLHLARLPSTHHTLNTQPPPVIPPPTPLPLLPGACCCSEADKPADLYGVLAVLTADSRSVPQAALEPFPGDGCTMLTKWLRVRMDKQAQSAPAAGTPACV